ERCMDAKPSFLGHRIDEMAEGCTRAYERKIVALGEISFRNEARRHTVNGPRERGRIETRGVDEKLGFEIETVCGNQNTVFANVPGSHGSVKGDHAPGILEVPLQGQHECMAIHNAGAWRKEGCGAPDLRLERVRLLHREPSDIADAAALCVRLEVRELWCLRL